MEKDHDKQSHWITLAPGMVIQALLDKRDGEQRVYIVTEETPMHTTGFMTVGQD
jgi:hypothetical protein